MKVLIDANVVLDVLLNRQPWVVESQAVWDANHRREIQGHLVATALTNLFYIARKLVGQQLALKGVIDCLSAFDILPVDGVILADASALPGKDFEDNVLIRCAVQSQTDVIVTRNPADFIHSPITVLSPDELLKRIQSATP